MPYRAVATSLWCLAVLALTALVAVPVEAQTLDKRTRERAKAMLGQVRELIKDKYYDPTFHGVDLDTRFKAAETQLETAASLGHAMAIIAQAVIDLDDSHTYFIPPIRSDSFEYGWQMQMVGDDCFVTAVKPGSDADAKGLKPGDRLLRIHPFVPARGELWKVQYLYYVLSPRSTLKVVAESPGGQPRELELAAKVTKGQRVVNLSILDLVSALDEMSREAQVRSNQAARVGDVAVWKLSSFGFDPAQVDRVVDSVVKGASGLVIDLRGNGGGYMKTLEQVFGRLFDRDVKLADVRGRKSATVSMAKKRKTPFSGRIVALTDSNSGSAAEIFARVMQLEHRGVVVGDRSAGSVMQAHVHPMTMGLDTVIFFSASVTDADLIMSDGKSLEHVGVTPDELLLPTAADLAAGRDPVLARALAILGSTIGPEAAGKLFPTEWK